MTLREELRTTFFKPKTWAFWRALILACSLCCLLGHWLEIPYCSIMNAAFGIVADDYAVITDPWFVPYFVYGYGAGAMTFLLEPIKERILARRKTIWGALLEMFVLTVAIAAVMETGFGLILNQPDATGTYPFWDNSQLPLNILGQGWLVNDIFIGIAAMFYLWVVFPAVSIELDKLGGKRANVVFAVLMAIFLAFCAQTVYLFYLP